MDKTKAKIQELVPEIMELKFGCEVKIVDYSGFGLLGKDAEYRELLEGFDGYATIVNYFIDYSPRDYDGSPDRDDIVYFQLLVEGVYIELKDIICEDYLIILGRPITLADVLLAIGKQNKPKPVLNLFSTQLEMYDQDDERDNALWDLTKTYDDQSQETKDFIGEILQANK